LTNTSSTNINASLFVRIDGQALGGTNFDGLRVTGNNATVRGLIVTRFSGAGIHALNTTNVVVTENFLGTDNAGIIAQAARNKKAPIAAGELDQLLGNHTGLRVDAGKSFSTLPLSGLGYGNLIAGNLHRGAVFNGTVGDLFTWNYVYANGSPDSYGGGVLLRGTTDFVADHLYVGKCIPNGIELDNGKTGSSVGTIIQNSYFKLNSLALKGAAICDSGAPFTAIRDNAFDWNYNDGISINGLTATGPNAILGNIFKWNKVGIDIDKSRSIQIGADDPAQWNYFYGDAVSILSKESNDIFWAFNAFEFLNTPVKVDSITALQGTRTEQSSDVIFSVTGNGPPNSAALVVFYSPTAPPSGAVSPIGTPFKQTTVTTDANGKFTAAVTVPAVSAPPFAGVSASFGFLDSSEIIFAKPVATGNFSQTLTGSSSLAVGQTAEYIVTYKYQGSSASPDAYFSASVSLPDGLTALSYTLDYGPNSDASEPPEPQLAEIRGKVHDGEFVTIKLQVRANVSGNYSISFRPDVKIGDNSVAADDAPQLAVQVVNPAPPLTYTWSVGSGFTVISDDTATFEASSTPGGPSHEIGKGPQLNVNTADQEVLFIRARHASPAP
jgi:hypothetical protein